MSHTREFDISELEDLGKSICENRNGRKVILLSGFPGSGKLSISRQVVEILKKQNVKSAILPQDGFHLYRSELANLANAKEAFIRRGAPFTFNAERLVNTVQKLNSEKWNRQTIKAPSFDHKLKDPVEDDILITPDTDIVIIEGNYVLLKEHPWCELKNFADESWFVTANKNVIRERLIRRHLEAGIAESEQEAIERADGSDLVNAKYIKLNSIKPDVLIHNN